MLPVTVNSRRQLILTEEYSAHIFPHKKSIQIIAEK